MDLRREKKLAQHTWPYDSIFLILNFIFTDANSRYAPTEPPTHRNEDGKGYTITEARLTELRKNFMYWFFDKDGNNGNGDLQTNIHASNPQLHKNFNFQLPFFGFRFNYTRVSWKMCGKCCVDIFK